MAIASTSHTYNAPKAQVFAVFADIGAVQDISPGIESSRTLNETAGLGGLRECDFGKGAGIHEQVTAFEEGERIEFTGVKFWGAPMRKMVADFRFAEDGGKTIVECDMEFDMKMGLLLNPIAKGQMRKAIKAMLEGAESKL